MLLVASRTEVLVLYFTKIWVPVRQWFFKFGSN
jgi:hypothetical protein